MDYQSAGVDIAAADLFIKTITPMAAGTHRAGLLTGLGGFGAVFDPKLAGLTNAKLVVSTDGVGTKLKLAQATGCHTTIGIDLVAMCVNDIITHGATPMLFLDYFATGKLDPVLAVAVVQGIVAGCHQAGCALVGGETAEMPGCYPDQQYDLAGFAVGLTTTTVLPAKVKAGDLLIGLPSSGVHANGFSLIHHIVAQCGIGWADRFDANRTVGETLLTPTRLYVETVLGLHRRGLLHAAAHITGGGLIGNVPRVLPAGLGARIDQPWEVPAEFGWLQRRGTIAMDEMLRTFNCGIGMVLIVPESQADRVIDLAGMNTNPILLGQVVSGASKITLPAETYWQ